MSHTSNDDTLVNTNLRDLLSAAEKSSSESPKNRLVGGDSHSRHSEPTVEINHPAESGIIRNIDDYYDNNSETEEIIFPFGIDPDIELESLGLD